MQIRTRPAASAYVLLIGARREGVPVLCIETQHTKAFLTAQPNKNDRNDARGIAEMMRVNMFRPIHE